jgi:putative membrane protein
MQPFTPEEHASIAGAITRAEKTTSGEIVVVVARASSSYRYFTLMCVALLALAVPLPFIHFTKWPVEYIYLVQLMIFGAGALLVVQNLHTTTGRTGVLIYVSDAERYAEVIADDGIYKKVTPEVWDALIAVLTAHIGRGTRTEGFIAAIETCGAILAEHFPPEAADRNELPNHLIVLDAAEPA